MSYLRWGHPLKYVDGNSEDYIWGGESKGKKYVQNYGPISNKGIIELLSQEWKPEDEWDKILKQRVIEQLAKTLNVKLRKKPLTFKQYMKLELKNMREFNEENKEFLDELGGKK